MAILLCTDDVSITGIILRDWKPLAAGARMDARLVMAANNVAILNERKASIDVSAADRSQFGGFWRHHADAPLQGRNAIVASVCPQVTIQLPFTHSFQQIA